MTTNNPQPLTTEELAALKAVERDDDINSLLWIALKDKGLVETWCHAAPDGVYTELTLAGRTALAASAPSPSHTVAEPAEDARDALNEQQNLASVLQMQFGYEWRDSNSSATKVRLAIEALQAQIAALASNAPAANEPAVTGGEHPTIVCLCGSTRFSQAFQDANFNETLAGRIVLTIGCDMKSDNELFKNKSEDELNEIKMRLDWLHFKKINLADEVLILNVGGYIGQSTRRELEYAKEQGKHIRFLEDES